MRGERANNLGSTNMLDRAWLDREMATATDPQMYQSNTDLTCYGFIFVATDLIHVCLAGEFPGQVRYVKRILERLEHDRDRWHERLRLH